ncbi:MAG TPA: methyltransferase domain-containing protein [Kofleriaceae bacterium]|nr:methyltransferase domain-containing protein [Kofleriaceae bacterium]
MRPDHVPVCPGCRTLTGDRLDVRTVHRAGDTLVCSCGRRYPIVDGVPIVLADATAYLRDDVAAVVERDLAPDVAALLAAGGPDDAPYPRMLEHLSTYLDAHWGDHATPPPDGPGAGPGGLAFPALVERIAERAGHPVQLAVELGCSVGRIVAELAPGAGHVVGLDLHFGAVRRARRLLAGEPLAYPRRLTGRRYAPAITSAGPRAVSPDRVTLLCADALDPPLVPGFYDRVVAVNVLDSVRSPRQLLSVVDGLCAPGGEIILTSPYAWLSSVMPDDERLGGDDPAATLATLLREGTNLRARYTIEDEAQLPWTLRRDGRSAATYCIHYIRARKMGP